MRGSVQLNTEPKPQITVSASLFSHRPCVAVSANFRFYT
jgi:hypothetical protein